MSSGALPPYDPGGCSPLAPPSGQDGPLEVHSRKGQPMGYPHPPLDCTRAQLNGAAFSGGCAPLPRLQKNEAPSEAPLLSGSSRDGGPSPVPAVPALAASRPQHPLTYAPRSDAERQRESWRHKARRLLSCSGLDEVVDQRTLSGCAVQCFVLCAWLSLSLALAPAQPSRTNPNQLAAGRTGSASPSRLAAPFNPIQELAMDSFNLSRGAACAATESGSQTEEAQPWTEQGDGPGGGHDGPQDGPAPDGASASDPAAGSSPP